VVGGRTLTSDNLSPGNLPAWMIELAEQLGMIEPDALLPTGLIVGSAVIADCTPLTLTTDIGKLTSFFQWHLTDVERFKTNFNNRCLRQRQRDRR
jgi:hypothetical protein